MEFDILQQVDGAAAEAAASRDNDASAASGVACGDSGLNGGGIVGGTIRDGTVIYNVKDGHD